METAVTPADVWAALKATAERLDRSIELSERRMAEFFEALERTRAEFDRRQAELDRRFGEMQAAADLRQAEIDRRQAEADRRQAQIDRRFEEMQAAMAKSSAKTDAEAQRMLRKLADLGDRIGEFAESMVIPGVQRLLAERGIEVHGISPRAFRRFDGQSAEFDAVIVNDRYVAVVEVKSRLKSADVAEHVSRMDNFKKFFPEFRDRRGIGVVAGMLIDEEAGKFAYREGLFVLEQSGETIRIRNDAKFRPKEW